MKVIKIFGTICLYWVFAWNVGYRIMDYLEWIILTLSVLSIICFVFAFSFSVHTHRTDRIE